MREEAIYAALEKLGCRGIRTRGRRVWSTCPFEDRHEGGVDRRPNSFMVDIEDGGPSWYHCFACHAHGTLEKLVGLRPSEAVANVTWTRRLFRRKPAAQAEGRWEWYRRFPPLGSVSQAVSFVRLRGLEPVELDEWEPRVDREAARILFPIATADGEFVTATGRSYAHAKPKWLHYSVSQDGIGRTGTPVSVKSYLFGENVAANRARAVSGASWFRRAKVPVVVVEGPLDAVAVGAAVDWPVVAVLGSYLSDEQGQRLARLARIARGDVLVLPDGDQAGEKLAASVVSWGKGTRTKVRVLPLPNGRDPCDLGPLRLMELFRSAEADDSADKVREGGEV